jgi:hypothetical protein
MTSDLDVARDALAMIASAERGDRQSLELMLSTYRGPERDAERGQLVGALLAHSTCLVRLAASEAGVPAHQVLASVAVSLNEIE